MLQASENPQTQETAAIMGKHISRMESYVSSMSNLRRMEDAQPEYKLIDLQTVASSLYDLSLIHISSKKSVLPACFCPQKNTFRTWNTHIRKCFVLSISGFGHRKYAERSL